jgi:hypothetical protein
MAILYCYKVLHFRKVGFGIIKVSPIKSLLMGGRLMILGSFWPTILGSDFLECWGESQITNPRPKEVIKVFAR